MGIIDALFKNKEELVSKIISLLEGKETVIKIDLSKTTMNVGKTKIELNGEIELKILPFTKKKK